MIIWFIEDSHSYLVLLHCPLVQFLRQGRDVRDYREMQETEMSRDIESLVVKKESSECSGLLSSIDHNVTDAHTGYNVHREALNEAAVISGDQFHEPHALVVRL